MNDITLPANGFLALPARACTVLCLSGELWLTRDRDAADHILGPGQQMSVQPRDRAAVQALRPSRLRLVEAG